MFKKYKYLVNSWFVVVLAGPVLTALLFAIYFRGQEDYRLYLFFIGFGILFGSVLSLPAYFLLAVCVGKALFIWMSWDKEAPFFRKIRWGRLLKGII